MLGIIRLPAGADYIEFLLARIFHIVAAYDSGMTFDIIFRQLKGYPSARKSAVTVHGGLRLFGTSREWHRLGL